MKLSTDQLRELLPDLFEFRLLEELAQAGEFRTLDSGTALIRPGEFIRSVPIVLSGTIKVLRPDTEGREALLYYLGSHDSCAMSLTCCVGRRASEVAAVAEERTTVLLVPAEQVDNWLCQYPTWKAFIFRTYQRRFENLLETVDSVIFHQLDQRLLEYLRKKTAAAGSHTLLITHEEIARELATSREVVSRLLKQLEKNGRVALTRNKITYYGGAM
ncbi:Crp/Fnr family transcriptional regulator [Siphonobacter aquaeclarae]|uniref:CRP/FNR family transcriptional regulator, anaerobic regulatory protein n=1 Tax=Siphonobacter aquaeclarae TaxID=563176 RepID=A0A1G9S6A8_9BACT|nr:Crp/Fnr family transcriptional regulator [Siphonobacter aquaeclarae]SDM30295.1 CRP/FNR family transcriptional regulator, anaerobic regulatory protein [Siphonobacter aquaeclarae]